jgi:hypothetical protein
MDEVAMGGTVLATKERRESKRIFDGINGINGMD